MTKAPAKGPQERTAATGVAEKAVWAMTEVTVAMGATVDAAEMAGRVGKVDKADWAATGEEE